MVEKEECQEKKERNLETKCTTVDVEKCQQVAVWSCYFVWLLFKMHPCRWTRRSVIRWKLRNVKRWRKRSARWWRRCSARWRRRRCARSWWRRCASRLAPVFVSLLSRWWKWFVICMDTNIWAGGGGEVLCGGKGGMLFEGGGAVQGGDDWAMQPGARLNIRNTYIQVTFSFLGCFYCACTTMFIQRALQEIWYIISIYLFDRQVPQISLNKRRKFKI